MNDKLTEEELEALQPDTGVSSPNSIAYNLHIRSRLARRCFFALNLCALIFLVASASGEMQSWIIQFNAPPPSGITELKVRTLLVSLLFLCVNLALAFDRFYIEALTSALSIYLYAIATRFSQFFDYLTFDDLWPFSVFAAARLIPLALLTILIREEVNRIKPERPH